MQKRNAWWVSLALVASSCGEGGDARPPSGVDSELEAYCAVAQRDDLQLWVGDVLTLCAPSSDHDEVLCSGGRAASSGAITQIDLASDLTPRRLLPAQGGRVVALLDDERLVVLDAAGAIERELAGWASDPWVSDDRSYVVWVGLPDGFDAWDFGVPTVIAGQSLDASARTVLVEDESASTPRPIPGTRDVLFVSTSTGLASFWRVTPGGAPVQITNVGLDEVGPEFVPVADRQLAWADGALFYGVDEEDGTTRVWRLDLGTRDAREVGPGAWPRASSAGSVLALQPAGASACAARYPVGGTP